MPASNPSPESYSFGQRLLSQSWPRTVAKVFAWMGAVALAGVVALLLVIATSLAVAYPNLPDISDLSDYRPKLPLRVFAADGALIGEFGEERRNFAPIKEIPKIMIDAVLAIEDAGFYQHGGVSYRGFLRAALANLKKAKSEGASPSPCKWRAMFTCHPTKTICARSTKFC